MSDMEPNEALSNGNENETKADMKGRNAFGRLLRVTGIILMLIVICACLSLIIPKAAGYEAYVVVSGSMEPNIPVDSLVYSKKTDPALLRAGDVIVFRDATRGTTPITHRVVSNNPFTGTIITKGDANAQQDANPVSYDDVVGKVKMHIPRIGSITAMFSSTFGRIIAVLILLEAWLLMEIGRRLRAGK